MHHVVDLWRIVGHLGEADLRRFGYSSVANMSKQSRIEILSQIVKIDESRSGDLGIPEVIYGEFKTADQITTAIQLALRTENASVLVSKLNAQRTRGLLKQLNPEWSTQVFASGNLLRVSRKTAPSETKVTHSSSAPIAVLAAGTSDFPIAKEAQVMAEEMGVRVLSYCDVGVAGLHRLIDPLKQCVAEGVVVIVAVAGMEAALPTVIRSVVSIPVIGVPTSVGYGVSTNGHAALNTMLASCAPGITVVNIDNGIGAGASAALIAKQMRRVPAS